MAKAARLAYYFDANVLGLWSSRFAPTALTQGILAGPFSGKSGQRVMLRRIPPMRFGFPQSRRRAWSF